MPSCAECERKFATERAFEGHREVVHQDEAKQSTRLPHLYRPSKIGDLKSACQICGLPRSAERHDRRKRSR